MRIQRVSLAILSSTLLVCGCGEQRVTATSNVSLAPGATDPQTVVPQSTSRWMGNATVTSAVRGSNPPCGWGTVTGETRTNVEWQIGVTGDAISLDEDMHNFPTDDLPYLGHLTGQKFSASYASPSSYVNYVCQFREASISGSFTSDSTFVAAETLIWGRPGTETTVTRSWSGSRH